MRILVTGSCGFIGHHLVDYFLKHTDHRIVGLDRLGRSGTQERIHTLASYQKEPQRVECVYHDLRSPLSIHVTERLGAVDAIFHLAAGSHVDMSISDPVPFVLDNVLGTTHLLLWARSLPRLQRFFYFSTDEVFGPAPDGVLYKEWDHYHSGNPYAATKAGAEEMVLAFHNTYRVPAVITHTMNVFGERQQPEKFIPGTVRKVLRGETVTIHSNPSKTRAGSRFYIAARHVADALNFLLTHSVPGEKYNIVGQREVDNLEIAHLIADELGCNLSYTMTDFHSSRPGHDLRYSLDGSKMAEMGWKPPTGFDESFREVIRWMAAHPEWLY